MLALPLLFDSTPAEINKRPKTCEVRFITSAGPGNSKIFRQNSSSKTTRFDDSSPIIKKVRPILLDVLFEAQTQGYQIPSDESLLYLVKSFSIIDFYKHSIKSATPMYEGGISFDVSIGNKYINVQFDNESEGAIYFKSLGEKAKSWDLNYEDTLQKLNELLA